MALLSIIIPTLNERDNIEPLLERLERALGDVDWEAVFVDDNSVDGTADHVRQIALRDSRVRILQRIGRRGLASACIEGMLSTASPYLAVMDADLQHDETILPQMLALLREKKLDLVVASRHTEGGSMGEFGRKRVALSNLGKRFSDMVSRCELSDPMSGYFVLDRRFLHEVAPRLSGIGFKILVDLVASAERPVKLGEIPYTFRSRLHGESKLDILTGLEYLQLLLDKMLGDLIPVRFAVFVLVGTGGVVLHVGVLGAAFILQGWPFLNAQALATLLAMTLNYLVNNMVTYRDRRRRGWGLVTGLIQFYLACAVGAVVNFSFSKQLLESGFPWYLAGLAGMAVSSVWNYGVTTVLIWRQSRRRRMLPSPATTIPA